MEKEDGKMTTFYDVDAAVEEAEFRAQMEGRDMAICAWIAGYSVTQKSRAPKAKILEIVRA